MRTPTSGTEPDRGPAGQSGFTLVELLAVLAILVLAVAAFSYRSDTALTTARFRALLSGAAGELKAARSDAIGTASDRVFVIDTGRRRLSYTGTGRVLDIPPGVDLAATVAEGERYDDGTVGIRFYGDGTSSGGTLQFTWNRRIYTIDVNWLTGNVAMHGA